MKTNRFIVALAALLLTGCATTSPRHSEWEYKILNGKVFGTEQRLDDALNRHVADGWEMISPIHFGANDWGWAVLKRHKRPLTHAP